MAATVQTILQESFEQFARNHPLSFEQLGQKRLDFRLAKLPQVINCRNAG